MATKNAVCAKFHVKTIYLQDNLFIIISARARDARSAKFIIFPLIIFVKGVRYGALLLHCVYKS